jgi:hypothetical protein
MWCIYKHTNKINGKVYIGQTINAEDPNIRWQNGDGYSPMYPFGKAIDKYGWNNFTHEIIETNIESLEQANAREIYWIEFYHSYIKDPQCKGYNATKGGDNRDHLGKEIYQLDKSNYSIIKKWNTIMDAARALRADHRSIQRACIGEYRIVSNYCWCFVEDYTEDWQVRIDNDRIAVICEDTGIEYISINEAARQTGVCYSSIAKCCKKIQKTAGGFKWRYKYIIIDDEHPWEITSRETEACRKVICYEDNKIFNSVAEAARYYDLDSSAITKCCKGKLMTTGKKHFYYEGEQPILKQPNFGRKKCQCVETGIIYESTCEASRQTGICQTSIAKVCGGKQKTAGRYHWTYIEEN